MPGLRSALEQRPSRAGSFCNIYQANTVLPHPLVGAESDQASGHWCAAVLRSVGFRAGTGL